MNKRIFQLFAALLLGVSLGAGASTIIDQPQEAYELGLSDVTLPGSSGGNVIFKECADCRTQSLRVTSATVYVLEEQLMNLGDLRRAVADLEAERGGAAGIAVYLFYNKDSKRVERLVVDVL